MFTTLIFNLSHNYYKLGTLPHTFSSLHMRMISVSGFGWEGREECLKRGQLMAADWWWDSLLEESWKTSLPVLDFWADWEKSSHLPGFQFLIYKRWWKSLGWIPLRKGKERIGKESEASQSCPTLCDPMDCSLPGSSIHGIFQTVVLAWVAISLLHCHI